MENDKIPINQMTREQFNESFERNMKQRQDNNLSTVDRFTFLTVLLQKRILSLHKMTEFM